MDVPRDADRDALRDAHRDEARAPTDLPLLERGRRFVRARPRAAPSPVPVRRSLLTRVPASAWAVGAVVVALAVWRIAYVLAGPDPDSDAYGHHAIARQILVNPRDLRVHWVWLPLFHYVQAAAVLLGATLDTVRLANVAISAAVPIVLFVTLRDRHAGARATGDPTAPIAALVCALSPIAMQMGTTGQTEPSFALLTMLAAWSLRRARMGVLAAVLAVAVLLRYEAWAILCAVIGLAVVERVWPKLRGDRGLIPWWTVALPALAILAWAAIRRPVDGAWFWFLRGTREFANDATGVKSSFQLGPRALAGDALRYAVSIPWRVVGYPVLLAPFGVARTLRREGLRFCTPFLAVLGFVSLAWVMRSSLGLDRHFVALVPLYATFVAHGIVAVADAIGRATGWLSRRSEHAFLAAGSVRAAVIAGLCCATFALAGSMLDDWMTSWRHASEEIWPERRLLAGYLRTLPPAATIFCDEAAVEVFSGLDRRRFERVGVGDPRRVQARADREGVVYVVTWPPGLPALRPLGEVVWRPPGVSSPDEGLTALRVASRH
ncbi:MAG: hypothetical protein NVSMB47_16540 [Polyangiales bacterium]